MKTHPAFCRLAFPRKFEAVVCPVEAGLCFSGVVSSVEIGGCG